MTDLHKNTEVESVNFSTEPHPQLNQEVLEAARELTGNPEYALNQNSRMQAESMARNVGIALESAEIALYCALRERETMLNDQEVLAAVLNETGDLGRLKQFTDFFSPNIFNTKGR